MPALTVPATDLKPGDLIRLNRDSGIVVGRTAVEGKRIVVYPFTGHGDEIATEPFRRYPATADVRLHRRGVTPGRTA